MHLALMQVTKPLRDAIKRPACGTASRNRYELGIHSSHYCLFYKATICTCHLWVLKEKKLYKDALTLRIPSFDCTAPASSRSTGWYHEMFCLHGSFVAASCDVNLPRSTLP
jgi:hypothetical protein